MIKAQAKNISLQSAAQIIPKALMFLFVMYLAKHLGSTEYGIYEFSLSAGYLIGVFFELGGNMILTKHVARKYYSSIYYALKIRLASIAIILLIFWLILFSFDFYEDITSYIIFASLGVALSSLMNLYFAFFRGTGEMKYEAVVLIMQKILFIALALLLMSVSSDAYNVLLSFTVSMLAGLIVIFVIFKKKEHPYITEDRKQEINFRDYLKDVLTLAMVEIFATVYFRMNQIFLGHFRGFEEVSNYGVAYRVIEVFTNVPAILMIVLFPAFAKLAVDNMKDFRMQFSKILKYLIALGFTAAAISWTLGEYFFMFLGKDYDRSYLILRYLSFPLLFLFPNYLITQGLIALNMNVKFAVILFAALMLNVILSLLLVPVYGASGSAVSIGICEALIFITGLYYIMKMSRKNAAI